MKYPWVYVESLDEPVISREELNHLKVRRVKEGSYVVGFDGSGCVALGVFKNGRIEVEKKLTLSLKRPSFVPIFPVLKGSKMDLFFRLVPLFDVERVMLFLPDRGEVKKAPDVSKLSRWRRVMVSSCKQCMNPYIPGVEFVSLEKVVFEEECCAILLDEMEKERGLEREMIDGKDRVYVVSGPEGGLSEREKKLLLSMGFTPVGLGLRIYPAEISIFVFLSMASFLKGTVSGIHQDETEFFSLSRHRG